ncbi:MAG: hypothetical protein JWM69_1375 [Candidatus Binatus sp.]|nr:hypothetical protein [Candidatus Binatus sp.]
MPNEIMCVERVLVAVADLAASRELWRRAGFAIAASEFRAEGLQIARLAAGAVEIDLCAADPDSSSPIAGPIRESAAQGGGIIGWVWGIKGAHSGADRSKFLALPGLDESPLRATVLSSKLPGVVMGVVDTRLDLEARRAALAEICGDNLNSVEYLEHIVVRTPALEDAIATHESLGVMCKRIREVGNGTRQAFFKLEQTVLEVVGPVLEKPGCWGLALMCSDIAKAIATARGNALEATSPKPAIQGGEIARIVAPLDGVAIAYMQPGPRRDT